MFLQTRRQPVKESAAANLSRVLRPVYYKYVKTPLDQLRSPRGHSTVALSEHLLLLHPREPEVMGPKKILRDPTFYPYTGLKVFHYGELGLKHAKFQGPLPEGTSARICTSAIRPT